VHNRFIVEIIFNRWLLHGQELITELDLSIYMAFGCTLSVKKIIQWCSFTTKSEDKNTGLEEEPKTSVRRKVSVSQQNRK
jgi:hypothetical protein